MAYTEYKPSDGLKGQIEAYWVRQNRPKDSARRVYADGCADIIVNAGPATAYFTPQADASGIIPLHTGRVYLGGTMTAYGIIRSGPGSILVGIRFRPGGLYALYGVSMEAAVDRLIEFPDANLLSLMATGHGMAARLDEYLGARADTRAGSGGPQHDFAGIYRAICRSGGQVSVADLSETCHVSKRTLERIFKQNVGISPKRYIRIVRFQQVLERLREAAPQASRQTGASAGNPRQAGVSRQTGAVSEESLLRIAYEMGYYDHAHLTNDFKQYAGLLPSELSRFYKTGITRGQYF